MRADPAPHAGRTACLTTLALLALTAALAAKSPHRGAAAAPVVVPVAPAALKKVIAARRGKVVLVNFWATSCDPCRAEFPALLALQNKYRARGLSVLFVSADSTSEVASKVRPFLTQQHMAGPSWIMRGDMPSFVAGFDPSVRDEWPLPHTYIYNRKGRLVKVLDVPRSGRQWEQLVKPML